MRKIRKSKKEYLSYIEETRKHYDTLKSVAVAATRQAVSITRSKELPITYKEGSLIIKEYSNGIKITIGKIDNPSIKVNIGDTIKLR